MSQVKISSRDGAREADVDADFRLSVGAVPFAALIPAGSITGYTQINKFGRNPDIDQKGSTTAVPIGRDIWDLGIAGATMWLPPTTARTHQIASSNDEDGGAAGDTGALTMTVFGLDANYVLQQEDLTLNGDTNVATANTYTMIHRMKCLTFGSAGRNLGNIDATADDDGTVTARVTIDNSQTQMAIFQVPVATTGLLCSFYASLHKAGGASTFADAAIMLKDFGGGWISHESFEISTDSHVLHTYGTFELLPAKSYVKMVADPSKDAQDISAGFGLLLKAD